MNPKEPDNSKRAPRTREASAPSLRASAKDILNQLQEDQNDGAEESDPPIVVRDGRTDHMAKGRAGSHSSHSTDTRGRNAPKQSISSTLTALNRKAVKEKKHRFRSLYRLIDKQMLYDSFYQLKRGAAPGVDGITVAEYEKKLDENLKLLLGRLIGKRYRAQSVKRRYIPKSNGKLRPLGIPALEDKIVQLAASRILESIYEADFSDRSVGYRKGKPGARQSSYQLGRELNDGTYRWIVEADIRSFFDEVDHDWLIRMIEQRVDDRAFIGLIRKWLKAGILEPDETTPWNPEKGTPQGGIISPILANIYLHYALDLWIEKKLSREYQGKVVFMRYADDIIVGFERKRDAEDYLYRLPERLAKFSLRLAEEKSSLVKFNRWEPDSSGSFTFLGFDFYWSRMQKNPTSQDRKAQDQQEEVSSLVEDAERLDQEVAVMAAENDPEQSASSVAGLLELLLCDRKLTDDVEILSRSVEAAVQVVEPAESAQELYLGAIWETLGGGLASATSSDR